MSSLVDLLNGSDLDAKAAKDLHRNGAPGFYLAVEASDAEYFAARRGGGLIQFNLSDSASADLLAGGAVRQAIPETPWSPVFQGDEFYIPTELFPMFNAMRKQGEINVTPFS